ncbi:MAG TPA: hypothetical protein VGD52_16730 [Pseudoduganella sp.]
MSPVPDDIRRFVIQRVPSVPYIEAVLLMRDNRHCAWSAAVLARRLYLGLEETTQLLERLRADQLVVEEGGNGPGFRYAPASPEVEGIWDRLAVVYAQHLIEVSTLIHTRPAGKAQMLADAFVWRKGK